MNWKQGEDVIIAGSVSDEEAKETYPEGWEAPQAVHPDRAAAAISRAWICATGRREPPLRVWYEGR